MDLLVASCNDVEGAETWLMKKYNPASAATQIESRHAATNRREIPSEAGRNASPLMAEIKPSTSPAEVLVRYLMFLVQRKVADILRQLVLPWQGSAFDQDGDDKEFAGEGCGDLFVDIVALAGGLALFQ